MINLALAAGIAALAASAPVFVVFALFGSLVVVGDLRLPWAMITQVTFDAITKYVLLAIPLFIFSGMVMVQAGMARRLINLFVDLVGHLRGGLGIAMVLAMGFFGAMCGSILAAIVAIGGIMIPLMVERGYNRAFVAALAACAGCLDALIPPSNAAIIFSAITGEPVSRTFAAGVLPGIVFGILLITLTVWKCRDLERFPRATWKKFSRNLFESLPTLMTPVIILGGIYSNLLTPTEAAAVAGIWAAAVGFWIYRELTAAGLWKALKDTAATTAMIFVIIAMATFLSTVITYTRTPHKIIEFGLGLGVTPLLFMLTAAAVIVVLGTFMEVVPIIYLTVPIFAPIAKTLGIEMVHLYMVVSAFVGTGLITPPVCVGAYTAAAVAQESADSVIRALFPGFFIAFLLYGLAVILFPGLSCWLPDLVSK
jgi:C4-dicarboxylate transporter DctM subunit